jgi:hypothetical protein
MNLILLKNTSQVLTYYKDNILKDKLFIWKIDINNGSIKMADFKYFTTDLSLFYTSIIPILI